MAVTMSRVRHRDVPDVELGRRVYGLHDLSDKQVGNVMQAKRREESGSEFLSHEQQRIVAISIARCARARRSRSGSLGEPDRAGGELIQRFFDGIEKYTPDLVSWNGGGFDLPVLHYRALRHGIVGAALLGSAATTTRRSATTTTSAAFTARHLDLMDVLSSYQARARASACESAAMLLGLPGKLGMSGDEGLGRVPGAGRSRRSATTARPTSSIRISSSCASS